MALNPSVFNKLNVADACSIWNILSSRVFRQATQTAKCIFCCTAFVQYECLDKPRKNISEKEQQLKDRLRKEQSQGQFRVYPLDIDDLLDFSILQERMNLGKGELSSIAFAKKTRQAFLTDDQPARKLASVSLNPDSVQTTPHLFGWLIYENILSDGDKDEVIQEHEYFNRPLKKYFEEMYHKALQHRLMDRST